MSSELASVSILIPARNEQAAVAATVAAAKQLRGVVQVIVIDDHSTDNTPALAAQAGADIVLSNPGTQGKGQALNTGLKKAEGEYICTLDADLGDSARLASRLIEPVVTGQCDMSVAVFSGGSSSKGGGFGLVMRLSKGGLKKLTGLQMQAPLSGQRVFRRQVVEQMGGFFPGFGVETALDGWAAIQGLRILEVPLLMEHRSTGKDLRGFIHRGRQFADVAKALVWIARAKKRAEHR